MALPAAPPRALPPPRARPWAALAAACGALLAARGAPPTALGVAGAGRPAPPRPALRRSAAPRVARRAEPPIQRELEQVIANLQEGKAGERGEKYVIAQFFVLACIVFGGVPYAQDAVTFLFGPCLVLAGIVIIAAGVVELRGTLSVWIVPSSSGELKTGGIFEFIRHPLYLGLIASSLGLSIATGSAARLVLTIVLAAILDRKATEEEQALRAKFPEYDGYCEKVPAKIFPSLDQVVERYS